MAKKRIHKRHTPPKTQKKEADAEDYSDYSDVKSDHKVQHVHTINDDRAGLRIFLMFLLIVGLFFTVNAYVETQVMSEPNVRISVANMATGICEMEVDNPAQACQPSQFSTTEIQKDYTISRMIDDVMNFIYYGGGKGVESLSSSQKNFLSLYMLKNFYEYSRYAYLLGILAIIGLVFLFILYIRKSKILWSSLYSCANITLIFLFLWHLAMFLLWVIVLPRMITALARSTDEAMKALVFGADFGFNLSKLHLFFAIGTLVLFIILVVLRRSLEKN